LLKLINFSTGWILIFYENFVNVSNFEKPFLFW
jgi:hypothetical protein